MIKTFVLFVAGLFINHFLTAQTNIGIKAGYNYSTARVVVRGLKQKTSYQNGYSFAIMFKAPFDGVLHFSPYITYNKIGYAYFPDSVSLNKIENTINYIDIVPALSFDISLNRNNSFIIGFGPVFGYAFSGKEKNYFSNDSVTSKKMSFGFSDYGAYDVGATGNLGFRIGKRFLIEASYFYSFANIENVEENYRNIQNRVLNFSLGYYIK